MSTFFEIILSAFSFFTIRAPESFVSPPKARTLNSSAKINMFSDFHAVLISCQTAGKYFPSEVM